jgi:SAM-dependent methyltransferase
VTKLASSTENRRLFYTCYDTLCANKDYAAEVDVVLRLGWNQNGVARILELGSGTGNHTQCFAARGHVIVGVDPDEEMLAIARAKHARLPADTAARISYFHGQVEDLPAATYDLATALFNVINYVPDLASLESLMRGVAQRLKPGASFIFDAWNGDAALVDPPASKVAETEDQRYRVKVNLTSRTDFIAKRTELTYFIEASESQGGGRDSGEYSMAHFLWSPGAIVEAAKSAGLEVKSVHPLFDTSRNATERDWKLMFHFCRSANARAKAGVSSTAI